MSEFRFSQEKATEAIARLDAVQTGIAGVREEINSIVGRASAVWESSRAGEYLSDLRETATYVDDRLVAQLSGHLQACLNNYANTESANTDMISDVMSAFS